MPFVQLPNEKSVEIYHEFFQPFDPSKPTALFLPPTISCSAVIIQYVLPRLPEITRRFNCLSLDLRGHGRSRNPSEKGMDCFVFAADIAFVLTTLKIASIHLVANSYVAGPTAFAFSLLFPSSVLSLSILGAAPLNAMPSQLPALMELLEGWLQGEDEEWLFDSMTAILDLSFSASLKDYREEKLDLLDWLSNMWFKRIGPHQALRCFGVTAPILLSPGIAREELATIKCPVLVVQGTEDMMRGIPFAKEILDSLSGSKEASLEIIEGGVCYVGIANLEEIGPILTKFLLSHISQTSPISSISFPPAPSFHSSSTSSPGVPVTSSAYSRYDYTEPLCEQLWELCKKLDGNCFGTYAEREPEVWEEGGKLTDVGNFKWRFSQRHRNERANSSRRGSVPQIKHNESTTVVTFEDAATVLDTTPKDNIKAFEGWGVPRKRKESEGKENTAQFRMDTWQWESTATKPLGKSH